MEDCDYEQAIVAFNKAIEIDNRSVEAYIGLAETYIRMSEFDKALEIAKKGYDMTGDNRLDGNITSYTDWIDGGRLGFYSYDASGVLQQSCEYIDGKRVEKWYSNGELMSTREY